MADALLLRSGGDLLLHGTPFSQVIATDTTILKLPVNCQLLQDTPIVATKNTMDVRTGTKTKRLASAGASLRGSSSFSSTTNSRGY